MVRALREVYAVVHPVYLVCDGLPIERRREPRATSSRPCRAAASPTRTSRCTPQSPDEVREAVDLAVSGL